MARMSKHHGKPLHKAYAETGRVPDGEQINPSRRFYAGGGFVKSQDHAQIRGAREGIAHRTGKAEDSGGHAREKTSGVKQFARGGKCGRGQF